MTRFNILDYSIRPSVQLTDYIYVVSESNPTKNARMSVAQLSAFIGGGGGSTSWGGIGGTLSNQTDLQAALNLKANSSGLAAVATSGAYSSLSGLPTLGTLAALSYPGGTTNYLRADGTFQQVPYASVSGTPTLGTVAALSYPGGTTTYLRADGTFATPSASVAWGAITGTLSSQTDLQTALNGKLPTTITTTGDLIYSSSGSTAARLGIGGTNQVLTVIGGVPTWQNAASGFTNPMTTSGDIITGGASGTPQRMAIGANGTFLGVVGGALTYTTPSGSGDFVGPASSVSGNVVSFSGTTGKLGQDSGIAAANITTMAANAAATGRVITSAGSNKTQQDSGTLLSALATLASPTFTGTPAAPTAAAATNTTQLATTAFVTTADNLKANLASPTFTGTPAAPTAATGTSTTQLATTAFVQQERVIPVISQSTAYTAVLGDANDLLLHPSADTTPRTFTIPANASVAYPVGTTLTFVNQNAAGTMTIAINTDTMRLAGAGTTGSRTLAANGIATAVKIATTEWIINGAGLT